MKKILLIIAITFCIFQMVVLATDIDIGIPAIDRVQGFDANNTLINKINPANADGEITQIEIWAAGTIAGCEVATFYRPDPSGFPNNFTTRDTEYIGDVLSGSKQTFEVSLNVHEGDYIGMFYTSGGVEWTTDGADPGELWYAYGDKIPCTNQLFDLGGTQGISLYGTGVAVGWTHLWNTKEISKWNTKEILKWNALE